MNLATTLTLACSLALLGCATSPPPTDAPPPGAGERPRARGEPAPPAPDSTAEAAERLVLQTYVDTDTVMGFREPARRFSHAGTATARDLVPEREFCHVYFALAEGTWCYRAQYGEPFRTRRVDAFTRSGASGADRLLRAAPGVPYDSIRGISFLREHVEAEGLACTSFFVRQVLVSLEEAGFEDFVDPPTGLAAEGIACVDGRVRWSLYEPFPQAAAYRLWDRLRLGDRQVAVILREGDEVAWFEVYAVAAGTPTLITSVDVWP